MYEVPPEILDLLDRVVDEMNAKRNPPDFVSRESVLWHSLYLCRNLDIGAFILFSDNDQIDPTTLMGDSLKRFEGRN